MNAMQEDGFFYAVRVCDTNKTTQCYFTTSYTVHENVLKLFHINFVTILERRKKEDIPISALRTKWAR